MSHYRHLETDRSKELESDPNEAIFTETFSDLPWELRDELDFPSQEFEATPIEELTL